METSKENGGFEIGLTLRYKGIQWTLDPVKNCINMKLENIPLVWTFSQETEEWRCIT